MKLAIVGSRDFPRLADVRDFVLKLAPGTIVVSGGAPGVDRAAQEAAEARGLQVLVFRADWDRLGKAAGPARNTQIVEACDHLVAFMRAGGSPGTADSIAKARAVGKLRAVFTPEGEVK